MTPRFLLSVAIGLAITTIPATATIRANPNILVINSYSPNFQWTAGEYDGFVEELDSSGLEYQLYTEYLDWKRFPTPENLQSIYEVCRFKYRKLDIDLIVAMDDAALEFALDHRAGIFSDAPVVFGGVFPEPAARLITGQTRVTGVYEHLDVAGTLRAAEKINPALSRVYILNEKTETGEEIERIMESEIAALSPNLIVHSLSGYPLTVIERTVSILPNDSIVLIGAYFADLNQHVYSVDLTIDRITHASRVPVYTVYQHLFKEQVFGGSLLDAVELGRAVARVAAAEIRGTLGESAPSAEFDTHQLVFNGAALRRFGISRGALPRGAKLINENPSIFTQYPLMSFLVANALLAMLAAISFLFRNNRRIRRLAYRDPLTGLVNQLHIFETTDRMLANTAPNKKAGILHIDIDNFRLINDIYGHALGDLVLKETARRLLSLGMFHSRVGRFGGDEFIVLVMDADLETIDEAARAVRSSFAERIRVAGKDIKVDFTIGIAVYPDHGTDIRQLLQNADMAMHRGKHGGKSRSEFFDYEMSRELSTRVELENGLRKAIADRELDVVFQPQVNAASGALTGFETLVRWNSSRHGIVPPTEFIPIAENSSLIIAIGDYVIERSVAFVQEAEARGYADFTVSVNVSIRQFGESNFADKLLGMVGGINPRRFVLEVTESVMIDGFVEVSHKLDLLRDSGFRVALDDFGTGYSSLNYLRALPINVVKIDKSFVDSLLTDDRSHPLTRHIIGLCHELGLTVLAEGIETAEQRDFLRDNDCDEIQGYFYSKPLRFESALATLGRRFHEEAGE